MLKSPPSLGMVGIEPVSLDHHSPRFSGSCYSYCLLFAFIVSRFLTHTDSRLRMAHVITQGMTSSKIMESGVASGP